MQETCIAQIRQRAARESRRYRNQAHTGLMAVFTLAFDMQETLIAQIRQGAEQESSRYRNKAHTGLMALFTPAFDMQETCIAQIRQGAGQESSSYLGLPARWHTECPLRDVRLLQLWEVGLKLEN